MKASKAILALVLVLGSTGCTVNVRIAGKTPPAAPGPVAAAPAPTAPAPTPAAPDPATPSIPPAGPTVPPAPTPAAPAAPADPLPPPVATTPPPAAPPAPPTSGGARNVVIVSLDGLRPDAIAKANAPTLKALIARGSSTLTARTIMPSLTLPSHTSMLTGVDATRHGITWNDYLPAKGAVGVNTVFDLVKAQGLTSALVAGKDKFLQLQKPGSPDTFEITAKSAQLVADRAVTILASKRPRLLFAHLADADTAGHASGWLSAAQIQAIGTADAALGNIVNAVDANTVLIVTADHGGHGTGHGTSDPQDMTIPWIVAGPGVPKGLTLTRPITTYDTAATALAVLGVPVPGDFQGRPVAEVINSQAAFVLDMLAPQGL